MSSTDLKAQLHQIIDKLNNEFVLEDLYAELSNLLQVSSSGVWPSLSEEQKIEVLNALRESEVEATLTSNDEVLARLSKGLSK